jgi:hypothetical protein
MLDQHAEKPFQRAQQGAVDHDRLVLLAVLADVPQPEPVGEVEIDLHRGALPRPLQDVLNLDVDLRPVKDPLAGIDFVP